MTTSFNRRQGLLALAALASPSRAAADGQEVHWSEEWDRLLIQHAAEAQDAAFDPNENMLARKLGPEYHYATKLRSMTVHGTRESLDYALMLLETHAPERAARAEKVIDRMLSLQDTDAQSKWYGLWGYYLEEPPSKMDAADFNWADFNGSVLLLIEARHGGRLPSALRARIREGIRHAAYSVRRRNVSMGYTNIAVQGTFVTLAAAELLADADLMNYATERFGRFARQMDITGSFSEYNSPTYCNVTIVNLLRIQMLVKHSESRALANKIHDRAWQHLGRHWHVASKQLAGPMSRCYSTDIGKPLWIQKATGGKLAWVTLSDLREKKAGAGGEVGLLPYRCPPSALPFFLERAPDHQHRELFVPGVQGTTWLAAQYCLGSVNRGSFWVQARPLVSYWPGGYLQMRVLKDDYDFTSALCYSVQQNNYALVLVNFRSPGGDKHPNLDPIRDGAFEAGRLRVRFDIKGLAGDRPANVPATLEPGTAIALGSKPRIFVRARAWSFGEHKQSLSLENEDELLTLSLNFMHSSRQVVRWSDVGSAFAVFTISLDGDAPDAEFKIDRQSDRINCLWHTAEGVLGLSGSTAVRPITEQDQAFQATVNGKPVPEVRLSEERLA